MWTKHLIRELAERRCIIVFGAGASANCSGVYGGTNPPMWVPLLIEAADALISGRTRIAFDQYVANERLLEAAEVLYSDANITDLNDLLRRRLNHTQYSVGDVYQLGVSLDPKVFVSSNFDEIFDLYCKNIAASSYRVVNYYEDNLLNELKSESRVIIKSHGSVSNVPKTLLTRSAFFEAKLKHPRFYDVLTALFLTSTVLFIGHSLRDPTFQLLMENVHLVPYHSPLNYALIPEPNEEMDKLIWEKCYNIKAVTYPKGDHAEAVNMLRQLVSDVESLRATVAGGSP